MIIARMNTLVSSPPLFFAMYLTLANTFLAVTHGPLDPDMRYAAAETYVNVVCVFLFSLFMQTIPQALPLIEAMAKMTIPIPERAPQTPPHFVIEDESSCSE